MTAAATAPAANEQRARDLFRRLFDDRDLTEPGWYWADGLVARLYALDLTLRGPDGMAGFFTSLFAAVPDFTMEIEDVQANESGATIRWRARGTFTGAPWMGIEPTGSRIDLPGVDVMRFDADGRVIDNAVYYDGADFARQIGMLPKRDSAADRAVLGAFNAATKARRRLRRDG
jgi:predicted ester cyclase